MLVLVDFVSAIFEGLHPESSKSQAHYFLVIYQRE